MKYTYKHITKDGTETTTYNVDENNKVTVKVKFEHNELFKIKAMELQCEKWEKEQLDKYY
tara:strand:- start:430 stop:609 length:180 start_codon:yes stop_codon:yes gene_type:complete